MALEIEDMCHLESFLAEGDIANALPALLGIRDEAEEYIAENCKTTDAAQYFSFADAFERLAYRRVENDPRQLVQVEFPFDRLYSDIAYAYIQSQEMGLARDALMQAVRWNPMNCNYRLDLSEVFRILGNRQEWAALSNSVIERAADPIAAASAYANLGRFFVEEGNKLAACACAHLAIRLAPKERRTMVLVSELVEAWPDWEQTDGAEAVNELARQGIATGPNAEIAICLIMCATDAAAAGDADSATKFTIRARDLVGSDATKALIKLIRESDAELASERAQGADSQGGPEAEGETDA